jgi:hypothetical protein
MAMTLISRTDVTSSAILAYSFSSIPQTYVDLLLIMTNQSSGSSIDGQTLRVNNDSTSSYTQLYFRYTQATGTNGGWVAINANPQNTTSAGQSSFANFAGVASIYFPNYTSTSTNKGWNTKTGSDMNTAAATSSVSIIATQYTGTAAITTITISGYALYPSANSTFSLYGIS